MKRNTNQQMYQIEVRQQISKLIEFSTKTNQNNLSYKVIRRIMIFQILI